MNKCVKIILERMKTNPEEFSEGKWPYILHSYRNIFTEEETKALREQSRVALLPKFEEEVMSALLKDEEQLDLDLEPFGKATVQGGTITYKTKGRYKTP
jgi:hypothetical protein